MKCVEATNEGYDKDLLGIPAVFFSITQYRKKLPTITTYPVKGKIGSYYWRVSIPLEKLAIQNLWLMKKSVNSDQIFIVITQEEWQDKLFDFFIDYFEKLDMENNKYFVCKKGSWRVNDFDKDKFFVNLVYLSGNFNLVDGVVVSWDKVKRNDATYDDHASSASISSEDKRKDLLKIWATNLFNKQLSENLNSII